MSEDKKGGNIIINKKQVKQNKIQGKRVRGKISEEE